MYSWLSAIALDQAEVVTATNRLARELRSAYERQQLALGRQAWRTPRILPWSTWLRTIPQRATLPAGLPLCLEPAASVVVWERLLKDAANDRLLNAGGLARQMLQTWQRLQDWCIPTSDVVASAGSDDQRLFANVADAYERELADKGWMDTAQLAACAAKLISDRKVQAPGLFVHAGFVRLHPALRDVLRALEQAGCRIQEAPIATRRRSLSQRAAADPDAEMRAAGEWARSRLEAEPSARIAIVRASLESNAARSARILRDGVAPGWQYGDRLRRSAVNVSYGRRLSDYPMLNAAFLWLKWAQRGLPSRDISILLRSPFTGRATLEARHRMEIHLRRLPDREWTAAGLAAALEDPADGSSSDWHERLQQVAEMSRNITEPASPATWADRMDAFVVRLGWPGDRVLDSAEFQLLNRWRELLNELALLEPVRPRLRFAEAFARLLSLAGETLFQPEGEEGMVQLLGPLEAAGLEFDAVWFANLESMQWPGVGAPPALVSRNLQRQAQMPDAAPSDTLEHARRVLERIAGSAGDVVLSWPVADRDVELAPSPLLEDFSDGSANEVRDPGWFATQLCGDETACRQEHDAAPGARPGEKILGGAATVQWQFKEPFSAFAYGRLGIKRLTTFEPGLSARMRGQFVHHALSELLKDHSSPRHWSLDELDRRIASAVDSALTRAARHADALLGRLIQLERVRLQRLLRQFVDSEKSRPDFIVDSVERSFTIERHGVTLDLRVDRIDRLPNGSLLIIDYKTGAVRNLLTAGGEPAEWQPFVYASAMSGRVGGLLLINIDSRGIVYRGAGDSPPGITVDEGEWNARLAGWTAEVDAAIGEIARGDVRINVAQPAKESRTLNVLSRSEILKRAG